MRAAFILALAVALAAPAAAPAAVVAERLAAVGPVLDGDGVTWGEGGWGADLSIHTWRPAGGVVERWRKAADTRARHTLHWGGYIGPFAASPSWLAFYTVDQEVVDSGSDWVSLTSTDTLWTAADGGEPQPLLRKVGPRGCRHEPEVTAVAVDGARMAWAETWLACARRGYAPRVTVREGGQQRVFRLPVGREHVRRLRLAGPYVAWGRDEQGTTNTIVVRELATGRTALRLNRRRLGVRAFGDFDVQPDGTVVALRSRRRGSATVDEVVAASPARPRLRVIADDPHLGPVEVAGGRAVYIRDRDYFSDGLVLVPLDAPHEARTVARWTREQQLAGTFDWDGRRLAYAIADVPEPDDVPPDARGRVVVEEL